MKSRCVRRGTVTMKKLLASLRAKSLAKLDKIICTVAVSVAILALFLLDVPCPILSRLGIPCMGCGMTRACLAALRLDLVSAFSYHSLFWTVPLLYLFFWRDGAVFRKKWLNVLSVCTLAGLLAVRWIFVLLGCF